MRLNKCDALEFVPECYKTQKMCDKTVNTYPSTIKFVRESFITQKCVIKQLIDIFFVFDSISHQYKTPKMCDRVVSEDPFLIPYCPNKNQNQRMCDEAGDDSLAALKLIPNWFVKNKMIKKLYTALYVD